MDKILTPYSKAGLTLKNHLVMAPMTRSRAIGNIPAGLMTTYYAQRTGAGLIITEGTAPVAEGLGYARIPGIFNQAQIAGWKKITDAVHADGTKIFLQMMHTGRIGHKDNLPDGAEVTGASSIKAAGQIQTDTQGMVDHDEPKALTTEGVKKVAADFVTAAKNAVEAGFDGIELHGANGYLIEQFLNPNVNTRTDEYGGSIEGRSKIVVELAKNIADAIGKEKVGIRFSPFSLLGDMAAYPEDEVHNTYNYLAGEMDKIGIAYIHISLSQHPHQKTYDAMRASFNNTIIACNGFTPESAETALHGTFADLIAFGKAFLANPDLDKRIAAKAPLNAPDFTTLFLQGEKGYTDYPVLS